MLDPRSMLDLIYARQRDLWRSAYAARLLREARQEKPGWQAHLLGHLGIRLIALGLWLQMMPRSLALQRRNARLACWPLIPQGYPDHGIEPAARCCESTCVSCAA